MFKVQIVDDAQIAADWALVGGAGTYYLFVTRSANVATTYAEARAMLARLPRPRQSSERSSASSSPAWSR